MRVSVTKSLLEMRSQYREDPNYLGPECPYDPETVADLRELFHVEVRVVEKNAAAPAGGAGGGRGRPRKEAALNLLSGERRSVASEELVKVQEELKELRKTAKAGGEGGTMDPELQLAIIKASVMLVERLTTLEERQFGIKQNSKFQSVILGILDDIIEPEQREIFMDRLAEYAEKE